MWCAMETSGFRYGLSRRKRIIAGRIYSANGSGSKTKSRKKKKEWKGKEQKTGISFGVKHFTGRGRRAGSGSTGIKRDPSEGRQSSRDNLV